MGFTVSPIVKSRLSLKVSLSVSELLGSMCSVLSLDDFSYTVGCAKQSHLELGNYENVRNRLSSVRESINVLRVSKELKTNDIVRKLQSYYTTLINLLNLAESYSGSFNAIQTDIRDYRNQVNGFKNSLEFDLG
jgi:hypothetical protein